MPNSQAYEELNKRAAEKLIEAHRELKDERLVLAIRYRQGERDLYLLEVLANFPGEDDDSLFESEFDPSAELLILGRLHLTLGNAAQLQTAIRHGGDFVEQLKSGQVLFDDGSDEAAAIKRLLDLE